jgi:hypothetical protein
LRVSGSTPHNPQGARVEGSAHLGVIAYGGLEDLQWEKMPRVHRRPVPPLGMSRPVRFSPHGAVLCGVPLIPPRRLSAVVGGSITPISYPEAASIPNFHLQAGIPARNAGTNLGPIPCGNATDCAALPYGCS